MNTSRSQKTGAVGKAARFLLALVVGAILMMAIAAQPAQAIRMTGSPDSSAIPHGGKVGAVLALLGKVEAAQLPTLVTWPAARLERLNVWLDLGVSFEGPWASEELDLVVTVLDAVGATYGQDRLVELARKAIEAASDGQRHTLRLVKETGYSLPVGVWYARSGRIVFNEGLFDDAYMLEACNWTFLGGTYAHPGPDTTMRHVVIGHELGHVLIDGLRVELAAAGDDPMALETLYEEMIEPAQWPHLGYDATEDLATELSIWALGVERTPQVVALRTALGRHFAATPPPPVDVVVGAVSATP